SDGCGPGARRRPTCADVVGRRDLRRRRSVGQHREGKNRKSRHHQGRHSADRQRSEIRVRGRQEVRAGSRGSSSGGGSRRRGNTYRRTGRESMKRLFTLALLGSAAAFAAAPTLIQNATVLTITKGTYQGSVLIRDGKIAEVGPKIPAPSDAV